MGHHVGGGEMHLAVARVGAGRDGGGVGRPHARCAVARGQEGGIGRGRRGDDLAIGPAKAKPVEGAKVRAGLRGKDGLRNAEIGDELHLGEALQGGLAWIGGRVLPSLGGEIAVCEAGVVVRRPDKSIEIELAGERHDE